MQAASKRGLLNSQLSHLDPFQRLPVELISAILVFAQKLLPITIRHRFPLIPLICCRRWNTIALGTADLWTYIRVSCAESLSTAADFARRARRLPLSIIINTIKIESLDDSITSAVLPWIVRCRTFKFRGNSRYLDPHQPSPLCEFVVDTPHSLLGNIQSPLLIQSVHLLDADVSWDTWTLGSLDELMLVGCRPPIPAGELQRILRLNPRLRTLHLELVISHSLPRKCKPVMLENLNKVLLNIQIDNENLTFSKILEAPHLKMMALEKCMVDGERPSVDYLWLDDMVADDDDLIRLGRTFPNVCHVATGAKWRLGDALDPQLGRIFPTAETYTDVSVELKFLRRFLRDKVNLKVVNLNINDIGLPRHSPLGQFEEHDAILKRLRKNYQVNFFGTPEKGSTLYDSWKDCVEERPLINGNATVGHVWTTELENRNCW